ncbi:unnamed protein product, partial [Cyprideis torosa]
MNPISVEDVQMVPGTFCGEVFEAKTNRWSWASVDGVRCGGILAGTGSLGGETINQPRTLLVYGVIAHTIRNQARWTQVVSVESPSSVLVHLPLKQRSATTVAVTSSTGDGEERVVTKSSEAPADLSSGIRFDTGSVSVLMTIGDSLPLAEQLSSISQSVPGCGPNMEQVKLKDPPDELQEEKPAPRFILCRFLDHRYSAHGFPRGSPTVPNGSVVRRAFWVLLTLGLLLFSIWQIWTAVIKFYEVPRTTNIKTSLVAEKRNEEVNIMELSVKLPLEELVS